MTNTNVVSFGSLTLYISYSTVVGFDSPTTGRVFSENVWSKTTGRHLNHFGSNKDHRVKNADFMKLLEKIEKKVAKALEIKASKQAT